MSDELEDEMKAPVVTESPDVIWLQYGDIESDCTHAECSRQGYVTWCEDSQFDSDVKYVRADIHKAQADELDRLRAENARKQAWIDGVMAQRVVAHIVIPADGVPDTGIVELITRPAPFEDK